MTMRVEKYGCRLSIRLIGIATIITALGLNSGCATGAAASEPAPSSDTAAESQARSPAPRTNGKRHGYWLPLDAGAGPLEGRMIFIFDPSRAQAGPTASD